MKHPSSQRAAALVASVLVGCQSHAVLVPLQALPDSDQGGEHLDLRASVELQGIPGRGWDMVLDLQLSAREGARPLVDLSRAMWRADGMRWTACTLPPEEDPNSLRLRLYEEEDLRLVLRCEQIQRPSRSLEVRIPLSGAGGKGYADLVFPGLDNAGDPSAWDLD